MLQFILDSKISKIIANLLVVVILFNDIVFPSKALALTGGPSQTEYSSFEPASSSDMVNLFTGDFSYNIPLLDVEGYPINIAYSANPGIDQEASWVGLGWTLNAGAINRNVRGIPDDFNKDEIKRNVSMKDHKSWGVIPGGGVEISGKGGFSGGAGVVYSNYKGLGYEFFLEPSLSIGAANSDGCSGKFSAGLGLRVNSQEGAFFNASAGLSGQYQRGTDSHLSAGVGINIGTSSNSRTGRDSWSLGGSASLSSSKNGKVDEMGNIYPTGQGGGVSFSGVIPLNSTAYSPRLDFDRKSTLFSYDFKVGGANCALFGFGSVRGFITNSRISEENINYESYGYLYEQNSKESANQYKSALLDYSRDKDGTFYAETPNAPLANHTYDIFSASAQGLYGAFHANRNDVGIVYDPMVTYNGNSIGVGAELGIGAGVNVGVNTNYVNATSESGCWKEDELNSLNSNIGFRSDELLSTASPKNMTDEAYFKFAGEKNADNSSFYSVMGGESAIKPQLEAVGKKNYKTTDKLLNQTNAPLSPALNSTNSQKTAERNKRQGLITYLNVDDASSYGVDKDIKIYPINNNFAGGATYPINPSNTVSRASIIDVNVAKQKKHHLSEISVLQTNGTRYVYGIPVYNHLQRDVSFAIGATSTSNGLTTYASENLPLPSGSRPTNTDQFFESTEVPNYAHSFLLTNVLSDDYVDRTGDGVTDDDLGSFTKFKYSKLSGNYKWRMPAEGTNQAFYSEGMYADQQDQRGTYTYGEKDIWYPRSIEGKNFYAEFILEDRLDGLPVTNENGTINSSYKLKRIKQIRLYAKPKFDNDAPTLLKTVNFEYDYSLCPNTPNSTASNGGKLTLKKIWFSTGESDKGVLNPYSFFYSDPLHAGNPTYNSPAAVDNNYNPGYNYNYTDRWGVYKSPQYNPGGMTNLEYPYTLQNETYSTLYASVWNLNTIYTPSGSKISVDYQSDDYAFVNEKASGQMYKLLGFSNTPTGAITNELFSLNGSNDIVSNDYVHINIPEGLGDIGKTQTDIKNQFTSLYLKGDNKIYFKALVRLSNNSDVARYEYIPGYAEIDYGNANAITFPSQNINGLVFDAIVKLKPVDLGDKAPGSTLINPFAKAGLQVGRMAVPKVMYPGSEPMSSSNKDALDGLLTAFGDIKAMLIGVNKTLAKRGSCRLFTAAKSFVRLYTPYDTKFGGGSRVAQIKISDGWSAMTNGNEASSEYGQTYEYKLKDSNGYNTISSGVANYEPLQGGDENSNRRAIPFILPASASLNNSFFQEDPYCESFYPNALVGYSRVVVKNLDRSSLNVTRNTTGFVEHEFYTTRDYPIKENRTTLTKQKVKPSLASRIFNINVQEKIYLSQGFVIKTNDMHGKLKSVKVYAENQITPISGVKYNYKTHAEYKELDNKVFVLGPDQIKSEEEIGVETDIVNDSRASKSEVSSYSAMVNISTMPCSYWVPLVFFWPGYTRSRTEFYSSVFTKTIQKFGILESIEKFDNNSSTITKNLLYDRETGDVLLAQTNNQFDKPVYNLNYPSYWAYEGMGPAYKNQGMEFLNICTLAGNTSNTSGAINNLANPQNYFFPGDEVAIYKAKSDGGTVPNYSKDGYVTTCWVIEDRSVQTGNSAINGGLYLIDKNGYRASTSNVFTIGGQSNYIFKIVRSGRRNLQDKSIGNIVSLNNPINSTTNQISITNGVLSATAMEYDDKWNMNCEQCTPSQLSEYMAGSYAPISSIYCNTSAEGSGLFESITKIFSNGYSVGSTVANPVTNLGILPVRLFDPGFTGMSTFAETSLNNFIQSSPSATSWNVNVPDLEPLREYVMCNCYCYITSSKPFNPPPYLFGYTFQHYETKISSNYPLGLSDKRTAEIHLQGNANWSYHVKTKSLASILNPIPLFSWVSDDCNSIPYQTRVISLALSNTAPAAQYGWNTVKEVKYIGASSASAGSVLTFSGTAVMTDNAEFTFTGSASSAPCLPAVGSCYSGVAQPPIEACLVNPFLTGLRGNWRPKRTYDYYTNRTQSGQQGSGEMSGNIASDGSYSSFTPFWWYQGNKLNPMSTHASKNVTPYNLWIKNSEVNKVDWYGNVHQTTDALSRPVSTIYGYNSNLPVAVASNAYNNEILSDGFEDKLYVSTNCDSKFNYNYSSSPTPAPVRDNTQAHTGSYSLKVGAGGKAIMIDRFRDFNSATPNTSPYDTYAARPTSSQGIYVVKPSDNLDNFGPFSPLVRGKFIISFWVKLNAIGYNVYDEYPNVGIRVAVDNSGSGSFSWKSANSVQKSPIINGWQKFDFYFDNLSSYGATNAKYKLELYNDNSSGLAYFDDLRIHPYNATMQTKVYDPKTLQLAAELDDRNYATYYQYDSNHNLVRVNKETEKGVLTIKETRTSLKK